MQAGYGMTNPDPLWHPRNLSMFDPCPAGPQPDDDILPKAANTLGNLLSAAAGTCHGLCKVLPLCQRISKPLAIYTQYCFSVNVHSRYPVVGVFWLLVLWSSLDDWQFGKQRGLYS